MASLWHVEMDSITSFVLSVTFKENKSYMTTGTVTS